MKTQLELKESLRQLCIKKPCCVYFTQLLCHSRKRTYVLRVCYSFKTNSASENPITQQCIVQVVQ